MAKKTATVAYEDPRSDKEAAYFSKVRRSLDEMGAPNSGELLHNFKAYVEGVYKAGVAPEMAASVLWHQHCGRAGQSETPCVAECPCPAEAACPPDAPKPEAVAVVAVGEAGHPLLPRVVVHILKYAPNHFEIIAKVQQKYQGPWRTVLKSRVYNAADARAQARDVGKTVGEMYGAKSVDIVHGASEAAETAEAHDSATCVPFTRLERNNEAFLACQKLAKGPIETDLDMFHLLSQQLGREDQEVFVVVGLDLHRNLRSYTEVARGQRDKVTINVEDVLRPIIASGPHGFVVAHNHPSGKAGPSVADEDLTEKVRAAAAVACPSIVFLDHMVIGQNQYYSFQDKKLKHVR
jgi:hypothetical protein